MYATKRRRRNVKNYKHPPKETQKSNPSKRHRERLNAELESLAGLLPFEQTILTKLDKLSILRLAVSYLRIKSYFQANLKSSSYLTTSQQSQSEIDRASRYSQISYLEPGFSEGQAILESLNGFILIVNANSEVFYASRTVEQYIGFHQSDIIHQSVFELIHSEDREEFKRHLSWNSKLPPEKANLTLNEILASKENSKYLERNFTVRFRCLLDNTSGFLTLDIVGRLSVLHGQRSSAFQLNSNGDIINTHIKTYSKGKHAKNSASASAAAAASAENGDQEPMLALFAIACPFGPPSLFELPQRESIFKTKHKINMTPISIDAKAKLVLGYSDTELSQMSIYELIHPDDLKYYANAHKELLKTGSSGLICYRMLTTSKSWQWLQTSMRIIYKSNKPECIIANHRPLTNEEGEELYYKRGSEFKLPYPYLYDFETNFSSNFNGNTTSTGPMATNGPPDLSQLSSKSSFTPVSNTQPSSQTETSAMKPSKQHGMNSVKVQKSHQSSPSGKVKMSKQGKAQQQGRVTKSSSVASSNGSNNASSIYANTFDPNLYKFSNTSYSTTGMDYYNSTHQMPLPTLKTELADDSASSVNPGLVYDSKAIATSNSVTSDYSSMSSASSTSSTSSSSSETSYNYHLNPASYYSNYANYGSNGTNGQFYNGTSGQYYNGFSNYTAGSGDTGYSTANNWPTSDSSTPDSHTSYSYDQFGNATQNGLIIAAAKYSCAASAAYYSHQQQQQQQQPQSYPFVDESYLHQSSSPNQANIHQASSVSVGYYKSKKSY